MQEQQELLGELLVEQQELLGGVPMLADLMAKIVQREQREFLVSYLTMGVDLVPPFLALLAELLLEFLVVPVALRRVVSVELLAELLLELDPFHRRTRFDLQILDSVQNGFPAEWPFAYAVVLEMLQEDHLYYTPVFLDTFPPPFYYGLFLRH